MAALLGPILFVVVVVGGLGSLQGALVRVPADRTAADVCRFGQPVAVRHLRRLRLQRREPSTMLGDLWRVTVAQIAPILPYMLLILVLIFKPTGLFGNRET